MKRTTLIVALLGCSVLRLAESANSPAQASLTRARVIRDEVTCPAWVIYVVGNGDWWDREWRYRVPVVVREDRGIIHHNAPVQVEFVLPQDASLDSIRVVDQAGFVLTHQASQTANRCELIFLASVPGNTWRGYYVYFGNPEAGKEDGDLLVTETDRDFLVQTGRTEARLSKDASDPLYYLESSNRGLSLLWPSGNFAGFGATRSTMRGRLVESGPLSARITTQTTTAAVEGRAALRSSSTGILPSLPTEQLGLMRAS